MSNKSPVNIWQHFDVSGVTYKVKTLGLLEVYSQATTFYLKQFRVDLRENADLLFGETGPDRAKYIMEKERAVPKGEELESLAITYIETGDCQESFCLYALKRFNGTLRRDPVKAEEVLDNMGAEDRDALIKCILGGTITFVNDTIEEAITEADNKEPGKTEAQSSE